MNPLLLCPDAVPGFLGFFDISIAPTLLFYSYFPIVIISLLLSIFVLFKDRFSLQSKLLLLVTVNFSLWAMMAIITWTAAYAGAVHFSWQLISLFEISVFIFSVYFVAVFLYKKDIDLKYKLLLILVGLPVIISLPTTLSASSFDFIECQSSNGYIWEYIYLVEIVSIVAMIDLCFRKFRSLAKGDPFRKQIAILALGMFLFLGMFSITSILGDTTLVYEFNLIGPVGMVAFVALLSFMIVRYRTFNVQLIGAQALIGALVAIVFAALFVRKIENIRYVLIGSLVMVVIVGASLIRGVRREIRLREELEISNRGQESLIHAINHQIKGYLGTARNIFAELSQSHDYGQMPEASMPLLSKGFEEMTEGVDYVQGLLRSNSAHSGVLPFDMKSFDLKPVVADLLLKQKEVAEKRGLSFTSTIADGDYTMTGDATMLEETFKNLITNAIKYNNPNGSIAVSLSHTDGKILFAVKDTGVGISKEDAQNLFKPGGMGKDSIKHNADASGYGLVFVEPVIKKHQGKIWYETEVGKGTTFFVELPVSPSGTSG
jgi:signal transduction histidine kinase